MFSISDITGVMVSYDSKDLVKTAIESFRKFHPDLPIIIVDGSEYSDPNYTYVQSLKDQCTRVFNIGYNIGHGRGLCFGIERVKTNLILTIDSDTEMLESPLEEMIKLFKADTYGVGLLEKTALDGYEYGVFPHHVSQPAIQMLHPYFSLISMKEYTALGVPFVHHGAPAYKIANALYQRGKSDCLVSFPELGHSAGKGFNWEGKPQKYIKHDTAGTTNHNERNNKLSIEPEWDL